ncbi:NAD(P)-binding protein [Mycena venus]|uniref:NAD(P)-binding protein n=1 Tax=Mycena venus TaxID=2733690 RepID=A0A8H6X8Q8_9AGAR|nr:NAD(P)-binding protein [Mycena venus]
MGRIQNARVLFNSVPESYPVPGETTVYDPSQTIDIEAEPLNGGFLLKTLVLSIDPYLRNRMQKPEEKPNLPPFQIGAPLEGIGIGVVLRSESAGVEPDFTVHQEYAVYPELVGGMQILQKLPELPLTVYVNAAGIPGLTAYAGWKEYSEAKPGEIAFVTSGAGAVGTIVIQLAKQAGMKVIASAGSEEKVKFMESIGADVAFNYKTNDTRAVLEKEGPIDVFWDNVGGDVVDAAIEFAAVGGRLLECGSISGYNAGHLGVKNFSIIGSKPLHVHGILVLPLLPKYLAEFCTTIPPKLASGEIKYAEDISRGLDKVGDRILAVQKGTSKAKAVVVVAEEA